jgi:AAA family ATP:ADP antiporter
VSFVPALRRLEIIVAAWGALTFGAVLASYFVFRPVRDALVLDGNPDQIPLLFTATFVAATIATKIWSAVLARGERRRHVVRAVHAFALAWIAFAALVASEVAPVAVGRVFYVWSSVFNLFVVSVLWSLLADLLGPAVAKRVYGVIAAGGTAGALIGPMLTRALVDVVGISGILVLSALLLEVSALGIAQLRRAGEALPRGLDPGPGADLGGEDGAAAAAPAGAGRIAALEGLRRLARSPFLLAVVAYVLCTATAATFVYLEQADLAKALLPTREARTELFATIDFWTNLCTFALQTAVAAPLLAWAGPGIALAILPLTQAVGITLLLEAPSLAILAVVQVASRAATHGITRPARELLFTVVDPDDKYRAKNAIDTMVYRLGDLGSAWLHRALTAAGAGGGALAVATLALAAVWLALAATLGAGFRQRGGRGAAAPPADPAPRGPGRRS